MTRFCYTDPHKQGPVAQLAEQLTLNQLVVGSSPTGVTQQTTTRRLVRRFFFLPMRQIFSLIILLTVIGVLAGCGGNTSPNIVTLLPSNTPETPTPTHLFTPTVIVIEPTSTPVPTATREQGPATAGPSPTSPLGPTATPAPPTLTATSAPTLVGLEILYFITTADVIAPGDNVTLYWEVTGAEDIIIYRLDQEGNREEPRPVDDEEGELTMRTDPENREAAQFVLVVQGSGQEVEELLTIEINCQETWFFTPAPASCPSAPPQSSLQVEQRFEGGFMIWVQVTGEIIVFFSGEESPRWLQVPDEFQDGAPERDEAIIPPGGRFQPVRGFGLAWRTVPNVRERLGWAIETEISYDGTFQIAGTAVEGETVYISTLNSGIVELSPQDNDWRIVPPDTE